MACQCEALDHLHRFSPHGVKTSFCTVWQVSGRLSCHWRGAHAVRGVHCHCHDHNLPNVLPARPFAKGVLSLVLFRTGLFTQHLLFQHCTVSGEGMQAEAAIVRELLQRFLHDAQGTQE